MTSNRVPALQGFVIQFRFCKGKELNRDQKKQCKKECVLEKITHVFLFLFCLYLGKLLMNNSFY